MSVFGVGSAETVGSEFSCLDNVWEPWSERRWKCCSDTDIRYQQLKQNRLLFIATDMAQRNLSDTQALLSYGHHLISCSLSHSCNMKSFTYGMNIQSSHSHIKKELTTKALLDRQMDGWIEWQKGVNLVKNSDDYSALDFCRCYKYSWFKISILHRHSVHIRLTLKLCVLCTGQNSWLDLCVSVRWSTCWQEK